VNNPGDKRAVLVTVDFALTYFVVSGEVESRKYLPGSHTGRRRYSVLTAWAAGKFGGSVISKFIKESGVENLTKCRKLIIPGKVAVLKGDIEESLTGWEVIVGPDEAMHLPKFLRNLDIIN
jgi:acetyl-CoA decarbonylase/synthase complex subunit gamma